MTKLYGLIILVVLVSLSCKSKKISRSHTTNSRTSTNPIIVDERDNQEYEIIEILNQVWFRDNLNFKTPDSKCYNNKKEHCDKNGRLYGVSDLESICPKGWRVPDLDDWDLLKASFGSDSIYALLDTIDWETNHKHTDESGLSLKGVGYQFGKSAFIGDQKATSIWLNQINKFDEYYHVHIYGGEGTYFEKSDYRTNEVLHAHPIENRLYVVLSGNLKLEGINNHCANM